METSPGISIIKFLSVFLLWNTVARIMAVSSRAAGMGRVLFLFFKFIVAKNTFHAILSPYYGYVLICGIERSF
jgi:hypothetical protein